MPLDEITDTLKTTVFATGVGAVLALVLGMIVNALSVFGPVQYLLYGIVLIYAVKELPKDVRSVWNVIILVFFLLFVQGIIGMFLPQIPQLAWASIATVTGFLTTLVVAAASIAVVEKYT